MKNIEGAPLNMDIACEAPLSWMKEVSKHTDYEYALAHRLLESKKYINHFKKAIKKGKKVMLDNSAFELGASFNGPALLEVYRELCDNKRGLPNVYIIATDVMGDRKANHDSVVRFKDLAISIYGEKIRNKIYATIQGKDLEDRILSFNDLVKEGFTHFTVPGGWINVGGKMEREDEFSRVKLLRAIKAEPHHTFHLLGCIAPSLLYLYGLITLPNIESIDSSFPVACTLEGNELNARTKKPSVKIDDRFYMAKFDKLQKKLLKSNLKKFKTLI